MTTRFVCRSLLAGIATLLLSTAANALLFRAYLDPSGNDANPCTLAQPCRLLPAALAAVADGGEIWMLGSANYNTATVVIGKSVSILAVPGVVGSILAISGNAIGISAPNLKVSLRNVVIVPLLGAGGTHGVVISDSELTVEGSVFANFSGSDGIAVFGNGKVRVDNSTFRNISNGGNGVLVFNGGTATISRSTFMNVAYGLFATAGAFGAVGTTTVASLSDSIITGAGGAIVADITAANDITISVTRCTLDASNAGIDAETHAAGSVVVNVSETMSTNNYYAFYQSGSAVIRTLGNNHFADNVTSGGALTPVSPM